MWDKNLLDQPDLEITAAPLALKDAIIVGASGGDNGVRDWIASLDPKTGEVQWKTFVIPAPGEPGSETWKDKNNAWRTGGGASTSPAPTIPRPTSPIGAPAIRCRATIPAYRPGDNLFTNSDRRLRRRDRQDAVALPVHRRTTSTTTTPAARRSSSTARSTVTTASSSCMPIATASTTPSTASTASSSRRCSTPRR